MSEAQSVSDLVEFDDTALKWKIGLVCLSTDLSVEKRLLCHAPNLRNGLLC